MWSLLLARVTSVFWSVLVVMLGCAPDADDPPYETETLALFSKPLTPGSLVESRSTASAFRQPRPVVRTQKSHLSTVFQFFSNKLRCELALSPLTICQVPAPRATFAEATLFQVCSARVGPRYFVFHQHFSRGARHHPRRPVRSDLIHCHPETTEQRAFRTFRPRPISPTQEFS